MTSDISPELSQLVSILFDWGAPGASATIYLYGSKGNEMSAPFGLIKIANEIAGNIANERNVLRSRRDDLSKQLADVEKQLESITEANSHASNYHSITTVEGYYHCPNCWIRHLSKSPLIAVNRDDEEEKNPNEDILTCHPCRMDFAINEEGEWRVR